MTKQSTLEQKAAATYAASMTGHSKEAAAPLSWLAGKAVKYAPHVENMLGRAATRGGGMLQKAFKAKPKMTLAGGALGLGAVNDAAGAIGAPNIGGFDPAAHAERMDPRVSGWGAAGHAAAHPLQSVMSMLGMAGKKPPVTIKTPGNRTSPVTNVQRRADGSLGGEATHGVDLELSPSMQNHFNQLQSGNDPLSQIRSGFQSAGIDPIGVLPPGAVPSPPKSMPYHMDPRFLAAAPPTPGRFTRSF